MVFDLQRKPQKSNDAPMCYDISVSLVEQLHPPVKSPVDDRKASTKSPIRLGRSNKETPKVCRTADVDPSALANAISHYKFTSLASFQMICNFGLTGSKDVTSL